MRFRILDALKLFAIMLPAILALRYIAGLFGLTSWVWQKPLWQSVVFAAGLSLIATAYKGSRR